MSVRLRRTRAGCLAALLATSACTPPGGPPSAGAVEEFHVAAASPADPAEAARRTRGAASGRARQITAIGDLSHGRPPAVARLTASWSHHGHRVDLRVRGPAALADLVGVAPEVLDREVAVRLVDDAVHVRVDEPSARWVRHPLGGVPSAELVAALHPAAPLEIVHRVTAWRDEGPRPDRGRRWSARIALSEMLAVVAPTAGPAAGPVPAEVAVGHLVLDVDGAGRASRLEIALVVDDVDRAPGGRPVMRTTIEWWGLDATADIEPPQVEPAPEEPTDADPLGSGRGGPGPGPPSRHQGDR